MTGFAKQSIAPQKERMDCFVALLLAMRRKRIPFAPGGSTSIVSRVIADKMGGRDVGIPFQADPDTLAAAAVERDDACGTPPRALIRLGWIRIPWQSAAGPT
jgi:hypothetical protein